MKQKKINHTKGSLGRWFQSHWSGFFCAKQLKKKKTKQINKPKLKCPGSFVQLDAPSLRCSQLLSQHLTPSLDKMGCQGLFQRFSLQSC